MLFCDSGKDIAENTEACENCADAPADGAAAPVTEINTEAAAQTEQVQPEEAADAPEADAATAIKAEAVDIPAQPAEAAAEAEVAEELPADEYDEPAAPAKAPKIKKLKRRKVSAPKRSGGVGRAIVMLLLLAALVVGGYFAYDTWLSSEARFAAAVKNGEAAYEAGEYARSVEYYSKAIEIDSKSAFAYIERGDAYMAMEETSKAIDDYIKAYFIDTANSQLCLKIGDAYFSQETYDNALEYYNSALVLEPANAEIYEKICQVYLAQSDRDSAIRVLSDGISATGDASLAAIRDGLVNDKFAEHMADGAAFEESGEDGNALIAYSEAILADTERSEAYVARARVNARLEDYAAAAEDYETAITLGAGGEELYLNYADVCLMLVESGDMTAEQVVDILEAGWNATSGEYILEKLTAIELSAPGGDYDEVFELELSSLCAVYYTIDGTEPTTASAKYTAPIQINEGETVIKMLAVSAGNLQGQVVTVSYNVTTIEMKAMAAFEKYFTSMSTDSEQDVLIHDVTGDGLFDMIVIDVNPEDDDYYRIRVYIYDGSTVNPIYLDSKVTEDNLFLCEYEGQYCFLSYSVKEETVEKVKKKTETYTIFTVQHDGSTEELKTYTVEYEDGKETKSDLDTTQYVTHRIIGVPSMSADAFGTYQHPADEFAQGHAEVQFYNGRYYSTNSYLVDALPNCKLLSIETDLFVIGDSYVYYYADDDSGENSIYKMPLTGGDAVRIGKGDGETLTYSGGWLYIGENERYNVNSGETVTDEFTTIDNVEYADGTYIFYREKGSDDLMRARRDLSDGVVVLEDYEKLFYYFTWNGMLYIYDNGRTPELVAYTVSGTYVFNTELDIKNFTENFFVGDGVLYIVTKDMIVTVDLETGLVLKSYEHGGIFSKEDIFICAGAGRAVIEDVSEEGTYIVLNTAEGGYEVVTPVAEDAQTAE